MQVLNCALQYKPQF